MTSPFDIEDLFPDDGGRPLRLPRRQVGSSPQGVAVTVLADYTLRARALLPSAAIVALLAESGVTTAGARTAISRLARRGVLEGSRQGRRSFYRLSAAAAANISAGGRWIVSATAAAAPWDGCWTVVAFSLPQDSSTQRRVLRGQLRWLGYAPLYDGLWISPHELTPPARAQLAELTLGAVSVFRARQAELDATSHRAAIRAWDVDGIAGHYTAFVRRWTPLLARMRAGQVDGAAAVRARTEVMDTFRRFPTLDPRLPLELLPPGWPREQAGELFTALYDGLAAPAERHVRALVARFTGSVPTGIRAHTTADMRAGLCDDPDGAGGGRRC